MKKETLDLLINQESKPRCHLCGFRLAESLKNGEQCPNCAENEKIIASYLELDS